VSLPASRGCGPSIPHLSSRKELANGALWSKPAPGALPVGRIRREVDALGPAHLRARAGSGNLIRLAPRSMPPCSPLPACRLSTAVAVLEFLEGEAERCTTQRAITEDTSSWSLASCAGRELSPICEQRRWAIPALRESLWGGPHHAST